jgi:hypothetical protein
MLKFRIPDLAQALTDIYGPIVRGDELDLTLTGELYDGSLIEGLDFITAIGQPPKHLKMPALNKNKNR